MTQEPMDILSLGEPLMEFSSREEGALGRVSAFVPGWGGDASNFAVAAARSGGRVGMLTRVGRDPFGDGFLSLWEREGVGTGLVERAEDGPTGLYIISRENGGHEFTYYRAGSAAARMTPDCLDNISFKGVRLLHVTGVTQGISASACDTAFAAMGRAREVGCLISYDPNYRPSLWPLSRARGVIHESVSMADIVTPSMEEASLMLGVNEPERAAERYLAMGASIVALKLGGEGALLATSGGLMRRIDPIEVIPVDCSGAGDTFAGAFAAAYLEGRGLGWCARYAVAAAGLSTLGLGCVTPIPSRAEILARMGRVGE